MFNVIIFYLIDCFEVTMDRSLFVQMLDFTLIFCLDRNHCGETEKGKNTYLISHHYFKKRKEKPTNFMHL